RDAVEKQRARVLEIKEYRDQLQLLQRDVDNAQRAYDSIVQRLSQTSLESKATQANVIILHEALPRNRHSSPDLLTNTALAIGIGTLLAAGIALLLELPGRRVRSAEDLAQIVAAPVIGQVRKAPRRLLRTPRRLATRPPLLAPPEEATS